MNQNTKLGLGGHSFIEELGNDPQASFAEQCAIVASCLDNGICWIDTTYYQERVALGKVLRSLPGRRNEARITAWNFFQEIGKEDQLVGFAEYRSESLNIQLAELQTDYLDLLVLHNRDDKVLLRREMELARRWRNAGQVRHIGLGMARVADLAMLPPDHPFTHVLAPYNAFHREAATLFQEAKQRGMSTVAMSPFVRGWNLSKLNTNATTASLLLRWVTSQECVDTVFVSMRRPEWVLANRTAEARGPLTPEESAQVQELVARSK